MLKVHYPASLTVGNVDHSLPARRIAKRLRELELADLAAAEQQLQQGVGQALGRFEWDCTPVDTEPQEVPFS